MIAPTEVRFYTSTWKPIGTVQELAGKIAKITGIHQEALQRRWAIASYSVAQRMSWAAHRQTTKVEDQAYSLLGIFDINLPVIYGEGSRAFARLQEEIMKTHADQSIFAWHVMRPPRVGVSNQVEMPTRLDSIPPTDLLASTPAEFEQCRDIVPVDSGGEDVYGTVELTDTGVRFRLSSCGIPCTWIEKKTLMPSSPRYHNDPEFPEVMLVALGCCYQQDSTETIVLVVRKARGSDQSYQVHGTSHRTYRLLEWESAGFKERSFTILRSAYQTQYNLGRQPRQQRTNVILFRFSRVKVVNAIPSELWNLHGSKSFFLPAEREFTLENPFVGRLVVECGQPEERMQVAVKVLASRIGDNLVYDIELEKTSKSRCRIIRHTAFSHAAMGRSNGLIVHPVESPLVLSQRVAVATIEYKPERSFFYGRFLVLLFWILVSMMLLPGCIFVPVPWWWTTNARILNNVTALSWCISFELACQSRSVLACCCSLIQRFTSLGIHYHGRIPFYSRYGLHLWPVVVYIGVIALLILRYRRGLGQA